MLVVRADAIQAQGKPSAGVDVTLGVLLLAVAALIMTGRLPVRRRARKSAPQPARGGETAKNGWAQRVLLAPRPALAVVIGAILGLPGALYLSVLHSLVAAGSIPGAQSPSRAAALRIPIS